MTTLDTTLIDLSNHRLSKAKEALRQAEVLLDAAGYDGSVNRSYYAMFNAIRSLLALVKLDSRRHSGVITFFDRYYVKTGTLAKEFSQIVHAAFDVRQISDYEDYTAPTKEQAQQQLDSAKKLLQEVEVTQQLFLDGKLSLPMIS